MATTPDESSRRRRTRLAIIDAAARRLARQRQATLGEIAEAAQTSRSTLHRVFVDRDDLIEATIADSLAVLVRATDAAAIGEGPAIQALRRLVAAYLEVGDRIRFLFGDPAIASHPTVAALAGVDGPVLALIERAQREGDVAIEYPPAWVERMLWGLVFTAAEALDDEVLEPHRALDILLASFEDGVGA